jgi:hypothetical protein
LRRVPDCIYVHDAADADVAHLVLLAGNLGVPLVSRNLNTYRAVTIIKDLGAAQQ